MAQTSIKRSAADNVRTSERIKRSRAAACSKASAAATTADVSIKDPPSSCAATIAPTVLGTGNVPRQLGCMIGLPCRPPAVCSNTISNPLPGPVLGIPTYPPGPGCFPSFPGPPQFMMFMMQQQMMQRQMQHMQQTAMQQSWSCNGFGMSAIPSFPPGMLAQAFPGMSSMETSRGSWPGSILTQPTSMHGMQPGLAPGCAPSPFPLTLSLPASLNLKGQAAPAIYDPSLTNAAPGSYKEYHRSCSATMTAVTGDDENSSHSDNTTQIEAVTDNEFATFLDSFLIAEEASPPVQIGNAALGHLDLSHMTPIVDGNAHSDPAVDPINLSALLETLS